jgi:hypothetical protein
MLRRITAFVVAAAVMVVLGSAAHSYFVQEAWSVAAGHADAATAANAAAAAAIPFGDRMIRPYAALTSIALLIAFLIAGAVARFSGLRSAVFGVAGALAIFVLFTALRMILGTVGIFGARGAAGLVAQMAVGLVAGLLFARLTAPRKS